MKTLNRALGEDALSEPQVIEAFEALWPKLETELKKLPPDEARATPKRNERDILDEILNLVRNQSRSSAGAFSDEDFKAALMARTQKAITASGIVAGMGTASYPDRILINASRRDGGPAFQVIVPSSTPLEAVEDVVRAQLPVRQSPPPAPPAPPNAAPAQAPPPPPPPPPVVPSTK
jgi:hypothetical protein